MLMRPIALLPLLVSVAEASPCEVSIPTAPDDVRSEIERWVRAEPRCGQPLEVRVVATDGGYYLFARDRTGGVRDRVVPDAQSAGVLVASWIADDAAPPKVETRIERVVREPRRERMHRWVAIAGLQRMEDGGGRGLRADVDVAVRGPWIIGVAVAGSDSNTMPVFQSSGGVPPDSALLATRDVRAVATVARTTRTEALDLRLAAGAGIVHTSADGFVISNAVSGAFEMQTVSPIAELSAQAWLRLGGRWAIGAGPLVSWFVRPGLAGRMVDDGTEAAMQPVQVSRDRIEISAFAAVRARM